MDTLSVRGDPSMAKEQSKKQKETIQNPKHEPSVQNRKKESWRGTAIPSQVDKYVDCDDPEGWC